MIKPSLAKSLLVFFSIIVAIESIFIGVLCYDILKVEAAAKEEFLAAANSRGIYQVMEAFSKTLDAISESRNDRSNQALASRAEQTKNKLLIDLEPQLQSLLSLGADPRSLEKLRNTAIRTLQLWLHYEDPPVDEDERKKRKLNAVKSLGNCYKQFFQQLKHIETLLRQPPVRPLFGINPEQLLQCSTTINVIYLLWLFAFVERAIRQPLSKLTEACELIRKRKPLQKLEPLRTEIGVLQSSFQKMSEQVIENENRRKSYVVLLQTVQLSSLKTVRENMEALFGSNTVLEKIKIRLEKTLSSINMLEGLLDSMTVHLQDSEKKQQSMRPVLCNSNDLLLQASVSVDALLLSRGIRLEIANENQPFVADPQLISRVILNLLSNAIKYSPDGGEVNVKVQDQGGMLEFRIQDSGPGITEQGQEQLFKRFSQLEALDGIKRAGSGLGLVICKELVEVHGGEIGCQSTPGAGSQFWFKIPKEFRKNCSLLIPGASTDLVKLERSSVKSLKRGFVFLLSLFVTAQALIFISLDGLLAESTERAKFYSEQKELLLETESSYLSFLQWGNRMQRAALNMDIAHLLEGLPTFKEQRDKYAPFLDRIQRDSKLYKVAASINSQENELIEEMTYDSQHAAEVLQNLPALKTKVTEKILKVDRAWKQALALQDAGFQSSYDFSKEIREKILQVLVAAAIADLILISAGVFISMKIVGKILVLKSKTESFAANARIKKTLEGNDELSFLDQRLCQVANEILDAESRRQELLAVINHDLRTPLSSILGTVENMTAGVFGALQPQDAKLAELSLKNLETLLTQINDLLMLEKIESGQYVPALQEFSVHQTIGEAVDALSLSAVARNLRISVRTKNDCETLNVKGDRNLFFRSVSILLKNAIAAADEGSEIELVTQRREDYCLVDVKNTGRGINPELLSHIFERFRFVDGMPVAGFGLPLAFQSCHLQGGSLRFIETNLSATTVELRLPIQAR